METVTVLEDGVVVSETVNGQPAALKDGSSGRNPAIESRRKWRTFSLIIAYAYFMYTIHVWHDHCCSFHLQGNERAKVQSPCYDAVSFLSAVDSQYNVLFLALYNTIVSLIIDWIGNAALRDVIGHSVVRTVTARSHE